MTLASSPRTQSASLPASPLNFTQSALNDTIWKEAADVAQLVEQLIRNQQVIGSSPIVGSISPRAISAHLPSHPVYSRGKLRWRPAFSGD
jgi:hypothetical protein